MSDKMRVLQRGYELIWREDRLEDAVRGLGDDFEWVAPGMPEGDVRRGGEGVLAFFRDWAEPFEGLEVEWDLREADGGRVLAIVETRGRGRAAGLAPKSLSDLIREGVEAFRRGGIDAVLPTLTEDVVWEEDPDWPDGEVWHGRETVRDVFRERLDTTTFIPELAEVIERENRALALMYWTAEGHGSGAVTELRPGVIYEFDGELAKRVRFFLDQERARRAFEDY